MILWIVLQQAFLVGVASVAITHLLVQFEGPFHVFQWWREFLLMPGKPEKPVWFMDSFEDRDKSFSQYLIDKTTWETDLETWKYYQENGSHSYLRTIRGTLHGIFSCVYCLGVYMCFFLAIPTVFGHTLGLSSTELASHYFMTSLGGYGIHFLICDYLDGKNNG